MFYKPCTLSKYFHCQYINLLLKNLHTKQNCVTYMKFLPTINNNVMLVLIFSIPLRLLRLYILRLCINRKFKKIK